MQWSESLSLKNTGHDFVHAWLQLWVHLREINELYRISATPILLLCPYTFLLTEQADFIHEKHGSFYYCPAMNVSFNIFPLFCVLLFWMTMLGQIAFHSSLGTLFPIIKFESTAIECSLFNRRCFSKALTTFYDSKHMTVCLSYIPAVTRQGLCGLSPLC
jgi:hypothetical protein